MVCPFTQAIPPTMTFIFPSVNLDSPLSLYSIPVIWFTGFFPHTLKVSIELLSEHSLGIDEEISISQSTKPSVITSDLVLFYAYHKGLRCWSYS